jgi:DtxR family Mn-dependent transcriptional regulator
VVGRIAEPVQTKPELMTALRRVGALPGKVVTAARGAEGVLVASAGEAAEIDLESASHLFVRRL